MYINIFAGVAALVGLTMTINYAFKLRAKSLFVAAGRHAERKRDRRIMGEIVSDVKSQFITRTFQGVILLAIGTAVLIFRII
jgi:hypothetical protein